MTQTAKRNQKCVQIIVSDIGGYFEIPVIKITRVNFTTIKNL